MRFKPNGSSAQGEGGGAAGGHGQPTQPFVATHIWKSQDYDWPVALTGRRVARRGQRPGFCRGRNG